MVKILHFFGEMPKYIIVGMAVWSIELSVFYLLYYGNVYGLVIANIIARSLSSFFGFFLHKSFTFSFKEKANAVHVTKYIALVMFNIPTNTGILYILQSLFHNPLCKPVADIIIIVCSFLFTKIYIFNKNQNNKE